MRDFAVNAGKATGIFAAVVVFLAACTDPGDLVTGKVLETRGRCWTILGDDGKRYAVARGAIKAKAGERVKVNGSIAGKQDCGSAIKLTIKQG